MSVNNSDAERFAQTCRECCGAKTILREKSKQRGVGERRDEREGLTLIISSVWRLLSAVCSAADEFLPPLRRLLVTAHHSNTLNEQ